MKKICFLTDNYIDQMGGEQRVLVNVVNLLADVYEIDLYCRFYKNTKSYYALDKRVNLIDLVGCPSIKPKGKLSGVMRWLNFRTSISNILHLKCVMKHIKYSESIATPWVDLLNKRKYDRIIGLSSFWGMMMMIYGSRIQTMCYSWFHNTYDAYFNSSNKYLWGYKRLLEFAPGQIEKLIVLTEQDKKYYCNLHNIPTCVIPNPLSFESENKSLLISKKLLFVGRLVKEQKGLDYLIAVLDLVFSQNNDWEIDIVGDGEDMKFLKQTVEEKKWVHKVHLLGNKGNVINNYLDASIFLLTSRWEGFGLVVTEAMECGLPIVSFETSGPSEIISDGVDGYLIKKYDVADFAEKVLHLMDNEEQRKKMGIAATEKAKHYSKENVKKMWLAL